MKKLLCIFALIILGGCAVGSINDSQPDYDELISKSVPAEYGRIELFGNGRWYPNTKGFALVRGMFLGSLVNQVPGALVITDKQILFLQWDDPSKRFDVIKKVEMASLKSADLDKYGLGNLIVIRHQDLSYDSFTFIKGSALSDSEKNDKAVNIIKSQIKN